MSASRRWAVYHSTWGYYTVGNWHKIIWSANWILLGLEICSDWSPVVHLDNSAWDIYSSEVWNSPFPKRVSVVSGEYRSSAVTITIILKNPLISQLPSYVLHLPFQLCCHLVLRFFSSLTGSTKEEKKPQTLHRILSSWVRWKCVIPESWCAAKMQQTEPGVSSSVWIPRSTGQCLLRYQYDGISHSTAMSVLNSGHHFFLGDLFS